MQVHPGRRARREVVVCLTVAFLLGAPPGPEAQEAPAPVEGTLLDVLPDEPTFVYVYGYHIGPGTRARIEGVGELMDQYVHTQGTAEGLGLIIGYTPALDAADPSQEPGFKALTLFDERGATTVPDLVLYVGYDDPYLKHCWPSEVAPEGGTLIHVYGSHLRPGLVPGFEGVPCTDATFLGPTEIIAVTPPLPGRELGDFYTGELLDGEGGPVVARRASMLAVYEGTAPPAITSIEPAEVDARGGTPIAIRGERLRPDTEVIIGDILALEEPQWVSAELILGVATGVDPLHPATPPGYNDVLVQDARGSGWLRLGLHYVDKIRTVSPSVIGVGGGSVLTFEGFGFEDGFRMQLGSSTMNAFLDAPAHISSERMQGTAPPLFPGTYGAYLVNEDGEIVGSLPAAVTVSGSVSPSIVGVEPAVVSTRGADSLTVTTDSWHGGSTPHVGGISLVNVDRSDPFVLRGEMPPLAPGLHPLELIAPDGTALARLEDAIRAEEPGDVTLTAVAPFEVAVLGGTIVTLTGTGFQAGLTPRLGGLALTQVELVDAGHLRGVSPPLEEGLHGASLVEGDVVRATFPDAVAAVPALAEPPVLGKPSQVRVSSAGGAAISVAAAGLTTEVVLRAGGVPLTPLASPTPCAVAPGAGGGAGSGTAAAHQVLEGLVPPLPPGRHVLDVYQPGHGIVAVLEEPLAVVPPDAPPVVTRVVSGDVLRDGSTRLYVFGDDFGPATRILVGQKPLVDPSLASDRLIVGRAPALDDGEPAGPRDVRLEDPRGQSTLVGGVVYVDPAAAGAAFVRGDANASGGADISDAVTILGFLFLGSPASLDCAAAGDIDGLGAINISDAIQLLQFLFLGGLAPAAPFPDCGPRPPGEALGCASFAPCGAGGGGAAFGVLQPNVVVLGEVRSSPGDPIVTAISAVAGQVVVDDPPGGVDLAPGQIIAGYVPVTSDVIQEGVTFLVRLEDEIPPTCMAPAPENRFFTAKPAQLQEVFKQADIAGTIPFSPGDVTVDSQLISYGGKTACQRDEEAGGAGGLTVNPLIDVDFEGLPLYDWVDGPNYVHAGFYKLRVLYGAGDASFGIGISAGGLTGATFFSGIILDSEIEVYVDSHLEKRLHLEKKLASVRKDHIVLVAGVPIHFAVIGTLHAGIDADAQVNLYVDAGAKASFKAGLGFRFDGGLHNLSGIDLPSISPVPDTPYLDLNGSLSVKAYIQPEVRFFAGLLFKGLTADIGIRTEAYTRFHAAGATQPVPCFQWGLDAGLNVTMNPEIQLFGYDLFDRTFGVLSLEEKDILGDEYGCKFAPIAELTYRIVPLPGDRFEVHFDASRSRDPDGGPLRFRWDFNGDGLCDRATLGNPRTVFTTDSMCYFTEQGKLCTDSFVMRLQVTDDEDESVQRAARVRLYCPSPIGPRPCGQ
jgi:hypothetical protein